MLTLAKTLGSSLMRNNAAGRSLTTMTATQSFRFSSSSSSASSSSASAEEAEVLDVELSEGEVRSKVLSLAQEVISESRLVPGGVDKDNLEGFKLADPQLKARILLSCMAEFQKHVPSKALSSLNTISDVAKFFSGSASSSSVHSSSATTAGIVDDANAVLDVADAIEEEEGEEVDPLALLSQMAENGELPSNIRI